VGWRAKLGYAAAARSLATTHHTTHHRCSPHHHSPPQALAAPGGAQAAGSGGRAGGARFSAVRSSAGRSSFGGGGGGGVFGGGGGYGRSGVFGGPSVAIMPSVFVPIGGYGHVAGGGSSVLFNALLATVLVLTLGPVLMNLAAGRGAFDSEGSGGVSSGAPVSVGRLQVGLLGSARQLRRDIEAIATRADTSAGDGLHYILQARRRV